jgi:hypothetical protein
MACGRRAAGGKDGRKPVGGGVKENGLAEARKCPQGNHPGGPCSFEHPQQGAALRRAVYAHAPQREPLGRRAGCSRRQRALSWFVVCERRVANRQTATVATAKPHEEIQRPAVLEIKIPPRLFYFLRTGPVIFFILLN